MQRSAPARHGGSLALLALPALGAAVLAACAGPGVRHPGDQGPGGAVEEAAVGALVEAGVPEARVLWRKDFSAVTTRRSRIRSWDVAGGLLLAVDDRNWVHGVDRHTGESLFYVSLGAPMAVPPSHDGVHVLLAGRDRVLVLEMSTGALVREIALPFEPGTTLAASGGLVFVGSWLRRGVVAFDLETGREVATLPLASQPVGRLLLWEQPGGEGVLLVHTVAGMLQAFAVGGVGGPVPQSPLWTYGGLGQGVLRASLAGDRVLVADPATRIYALERAGTLRWSRSTGAAQRGEIRAKGDLALCTSIGGLTALDLATGRPRWQCPDAVELLAAAGSKLLAANVRGDLLVVSLQDGRVLSRAPLAARHGVPNPLDGTLYLAGPTGRATAIGLRPTL